MDQRVICVIWQVQCLRFVSHRIHTPTNDRQTYRFGGINLPTLSIQKLLFQEVTSGHESPDERVNQE